jgi:hypothetical protein
MKKHDGKQVRGRPRTHEGGAVNVNAYLPTELASDLTRFAASLTVASGKRNSASSVVVAALEAYRPLQVWKKKGAPG